MGEPKISSGEEIDRTRGKCVTKAESRTQYFMCLDYREMVAP